MGVGNSPHMVDDDCFRPTVCVVSLRLNEDNDGRQPVVLLRDVTDNGGRRLWERRRTTRRVTESKRKEEKKVEP